MCIVCRAGDNGCEFLTEYERARSAMRRAKTAMLKCAKEDPQYDRTHKRIATLLREWNRIEHTRERTA